jgi:hypothetical protein
LITLLLGSVVSGRLSSVAIWRLSYVAIGMCYFGIHFLNFDL